MRFSKSLIALALSASLAACGGSDSPEPTSTAPADDPTGTGSSTVYTEGVITGFGSVYVNGQRYASGNANFEVGDNPAGQESDLKVGMVVSIAAAASADGNDPEASSIRYEEHLQGPVSFIDISAGRLEVLGQQVVFDDLTEFDDVTIDTLTPGDIVEISGYVNEDDDFYATLIELENESDEFNIKGRVATLDTAEQTFAINGLTIDYSGAEFDDLAMDDLTEGLFVKVEGVTFDQDSKTLIATEVEGQDDDIDDDVDEIKIAGIVKDFDETAGTFSLNQYTIVVNAETEFEDGPASRLANGARVKVEAEYEGDQLIAEEIEFIAKDARQKVEGQVQSINSEERSFEINGVAHFVDEDTQYIDESERRERRFNFDDIAVNDWLQVLSVLNDNGDNVALKVKRDNEEDLDGEVKGIARDVSSDGMMVAGLSVAFTAQTEFEGDDDDPLTLEQFLDILNTDEEFRVEVEGFYDNSVLVAEVVELMYNDEDGDDDDGNRNKRGKAEFKGTVESIEDNVVFVNGNELRFTAESELEVNGDDEVSVDDFIQALEVGTVIEVEGIWREQTYIEVLEAEIDTE
ncbi:DUF5666 domain-containing protein [Aliidiomarina sp. Khilg15.8]